ncbi:AbiH family protein [Bifidobacterium sp. ESL0819]|uniref:AbiH family protein n=1 Tax=Bifidobacterium sp. ESL0819 TaxID=3448589 RepID=UPI004041A06B
MLGNGFDLQCGLKTRFEDFMQPRIARVKKMEDILSSSEDLPLITVRGPDGHELHGNNLSYLLWEKDLTVWDFILLEDKQKRAWYDVEECIKDWVNYSSPSASSKPHLRQICDTFGKPDKDHWPDLQGPIKADQCVLAYATDFYRWDGQYSTLLDILSDQLRYFEGSFAAYILDQITFNNRYASYVDTLIGCLANDEMPEQVLDINYTKGRYSASSKSTNILDFNYTDPVKLMWENSPTCLNVHGLARENDIIFGIDGTNVNPEQESYANIVKFTKTYRIMALNNVPHRSLVRPYLSSDPDNATSTIKFFGHSLAEADYSYFQAIFDEVSLYESNTRLIFYYNRKRPDGGNAKEEMFEKVNHLITTYGQTLDNKDHGKNLLHKLLLEGRLIIKQVPLNSREVYIAND